MKTYRGVEVQILAFVTLPLYGYEWSASLLKKELSVPTGQEAELA
jgi:hypothetical protein